VAAEHPGVSRQVADSEWYLNPGEADEHFAAKTARAEAEGCIQKDVRANTEYRGSNGRNLPTPQNVCVDPGIPD
jgi:hypothetical protein